ncbi:MAG: hypothetical protein IJS94_05280 [Clostridia bacterium]|nr:hypothetical protein [Clostridia bacterium]
MTMQIVIALSGVTISLVFSYMNYFRMKRHDMHSDGEQKGSIASDIGYIKAGVDDLKREQREITANIKELSERVTRCEESCKQAHKRIDDIV